MVAFALVIAPRGLACGTTLAAEYRRLAMARVLGATIPLNRAAPVNAHRRSYGCQSGFQQRGVQLSSRLAPNETFKGHRDRSYARAAALEELPELTKKRLSREERGVLVKSFVERFMAENNGEFPSLATVLKETGGSRPVVKEILTEIQASLNTKESSSAALEETASESEKSELSDNSAELKQPNSAFVLSETEEDLSEEDEEVESINTGSRAEAEESGKDQRATLRRMAGQTPGEINSTYGDILSRLRSLGSDAARKKNESTESSFTSQVARAETDASDSKKPSFAARILPPRHGMFVRFLHPSATDDDLRRAFGDCGEIARVSAVKPMKPTAKFTYGFIDFQTADGLSNALRKNVEICGHKVETEPAPTQNTQTLDMGPKLKDFQPAGGSANIDNLVSKVVSMVPPTQTQVPQTPKPWTGQDANRFQQPPPPPQNMGSPDFRPRGMGFQRNEMPPPKMDMFQQMPPRAGMLPRAEMPPRMDLPPHLRADMPPRMDLPHQRAEMPPRIDLPHQRAEMPSRVDSPQVRNGMPPSPQLRSEIPPREELSDNLGTPEEKNLPPRYEEPGTHTRRGNTDTFSNLGNMKKHLSVCVADFPLEINVHWLRDALAVYGELYAAYAKAPEADKPFNTYFFEYLTEEGAENALKAHWVALGGKKWRVSRVEPPKTTVVRVSNVSPSTLDHDFIAACKSCGQVERVESRRDRVRDVFYAPSELGKMITILDKLNEVMLNQCRWYARPAPRGILSTLGKQEGQAFIAQQMKHLLRNQESLLQQLQVEQRDLRELSMYALETLNAQNKPPRL